MHLERTERYRIPPARLWPFVANTESLNREVGLPAVSYTFVPLRRGRAAVKARARILGMTLEWDEEPFEWVWPRFLSVRRRYSRGPMKEVRLHWILSPDGEGTRVTVTLDGEPRGAISGALGAWAMKSSLSKMFDATAAFERHAAGETPSAYPGRYGAGAVNRPVLDSVTRRLSSAPVDAKQVRLLARLIEEEVDERVARIRPFELADAWGSDRLELLRLCLHATRAGMLSLKWSIVCPRCHGVKAGKSSLKDVGATQSCESCAITFGVDLDQRVEVLFAPHPSIRDVAPRTFCFGGPMNTPHLLAQVNLGAGESREIEVTLPDGKYRLGWDGSDDTAPLSIGAGPDSAEANLEKSGPIAIAGGGRLTVRNPTAGPVRVFVERRDSEGARATAARVTALPEFRGLFDAEVLAEGVELSVGSLALFFSDLKGSTEMYERVGDAPAWGRVKRHFDFMSGHIAVHRGAIVKTMGDAVMAVFPDPADAVRCAAAIQRAHGTAENAIKIGIHYGPCLAVTADRRLDYFGSTVNLAQRVQSQSAGADVVLSEAMRRMPGMDETLRSLEMKSDSFTAALKGLEGRATLHRLTPADATSTR